MPFFFNLTKKNTRNTQSNIIKSTEDINNNTRPHSKGILHTHPDENEKALAKVKVNINSVYNKKEDVKPISKQPNMDILPSIKKEERKLMQFKQLIEDNHILDMNKLRELSWQGIPMKYRSISWKIMLGYIPVNKEKRDETLIRKREEYNSLIRLYCEDNMDDTKLLDTSDKDIFKIISADIPRTQPEYVLFRLELLQKMMIRILYIWSIRHPACGYVQGMNDLITPFILTFLYGYIDIDHYNAILNNTLELSKIKDILSTKIIHEIEGDTYWCICKILDCILDNYTTSQPGVHKTINKIKDITYNLDHELLMHLQKEEISYTHFAFRWVFCLLVREFPLKICLRLFDTYISEEKGFHILHIYMCAAIILKMSKYLKKMRFNELMVFLQNLPTHDWTEEDIDVLLAEAYVFRSLYENSPNHLVKPIYK